MITKDFNSDSMAVDLITEMDPKLLLQDMLSEDIVLDVNPDDFLNLPSQDIFKQMSEDLGISLDNGSKGDFLMNSEYTDVTDFISGYNAPRIKSEPPSPHSSSFTPDQLDLSSELWSSQKMEQSCPDTPPITPPQSFPSRTPPHSPNSNGEEIVQLTDTSFTGAVLTSTSIDALPLPLKDHWINSVPKAVITTVSCALPMKHTLTDTTPTQPLLVLQLTPTSTKPIQVSNHVTAIPLPETSSMVGSTSNMLRIQHDSKHMDVKILKRQQRMIKNRESACLSRKKKKEYLQCLEVQVKELSHDNLKLTLENEILKNRIKDLENEVAGLRQIRFSSSAKTTTALLAVFLMITLNISSLSGIFLTNQKNIQKIHAELSSHHGRSLLWEKSKDDVLEDLSIEPTGSLDMMQDTLHVSSTNATNTTPAANLMCPMYINKTESQRLDRELRGWVFGSNKERAIPSQINKQKREETPFDYLNSRLTDKTSLRNDGHVGYFATHELQVYEPHRKMYEAFLEAINRREDVFYVVSFTGDHLLLPALAHNKTRRPRMSLVLPAISLNDTMKPPKHHIAMMQIDCEVMNTKLVNVKESLIPPKSRIPQPHLPTYFGPSFSEENSGNGVRDPNVSLPLKKPRRPHRKKVPIL